MAEGFETGWAAHSERRTWIRIGVIVGFVLALAFVIRTAAVNYTTDLSAVWGTFWDFRDGTYYPVTAALDGKVPWDVSAYMVDYPVGQPFRINPPTYLVVHAPFQLLGYTAASIAMFALNLVGLVLLTRWSLTLARFRSTPISVLAVSTLVIISTAGRNVLFSGQSAILFTVGAYLAFTASSMRTGAGGVFISLIKPTFGLPVMLFTAATGRWRRALVGGGLAVAVSTALMIPFVFWAGGVSPLLQILLDNVAEDTLGIALETSTGRIDLPIVLARVFDIMPSGSVEYLLTLIVFGGVAALLYRRRALFAFGTFNDAAIVLACLAIAVGIYHSVYDMIILLLPTFLLLRRDFAGGRVAPRLRQGTLIAILVAAFNPFKIDTIADMITAERIAGVLGPGLTGAALAVALVLAAVIVARLPASARDADDTEHNHVEVET